MKNPEDPFDFDESHEESNPTIRQKIQVTQHFSSVKVILLILGKDKEASQEDWQSLTLCRCRVS